MIRSLADDHERLCAAVRRAGEAARRRFERRDTKSWAKADDSPVSDADYEANDILREGLIEAGDGYGWLSEENADDEERLDAKRTWIVDPIDGTRAFLKGLPQFAVCAALIEDGEAISSAIFNPITDEFFEATRGGGARVNGAPMSASTACDLRGCAMLGTQRVFDHDGWPGRWPDMRVEYRNSTSYRLALIGAGGFDATIALVPKADWDTAPGALIAKEAGGCASDHLGKPFVFGQKHPWQRGLVCAAPGLYSALLERLAHLPGDLTKLRV